MVQSVPMACFPRVFLAGTALLLERDQCISKNLCITGPNPPRTYFPNFFLLGTMNIRHNRNVLSWKKIHILYQSFHGTTHIECDYREIAYTGNIITRSQCNRKRATFPSDVFRFVIFAIISWSTVLFSGLSNSGQAMACPKIGRVTLAFVKN